MAGGMQTSWAALPKKPMLLRRLRSEPRRGTMKLLRPIGRQALRPSLSRLRATWRCAHIPASLFEAGGWRPTTVLFSPLEKHYCLAIVAILWIRKSAQQIRPRHAFLVDGALGAEGFAGSIGPCAYRQCASDITSWSSPSQWRIRKRLRLRQSAIRPSCAPVHEPALQRLQSDLSDILAKLRGCSRASLRSLRDKAISVLCLPPAIGGAARLAGCRMNS